MALYTSGTQCRLLAERNARRFLAAGAVLGLLLFSVNGSAGAQELAPVVPESRMSEVVRLVEREFVVPLPEATLDQFRNERSLARLDPYSGFLDPKALAEFDRNLAGRFAGIGVRLEETAYAGGYRIHGTLVGSPALEAGVAGGDVIEKVDGQATSSWTIGQLVGALLGEPGSTVTLDLRGADGVRRVDLRRREVVLSSVHAYSRDSAGNWTSRLPGGRVGYLRITSFTASTVNDFRAAVDRARAEGVTELILDLRGNVGGLSSAAIAIADELLEAGRIAIVRSRAAAEVEQATASVRFSGPLAILIDDGTKSAAEILSAALADSGRAIMVGHRTWGKGTAQKVFRLAPPAGGAVMLTVASNLSPTGAVIERHGHGGDPDCGGVWPDLGGTIEADDEQWQAWREELYQRDEQALESGREPLVSTSPEDPVLRRALELLADPGKDESSRPASCSLLPSAFSMTP